MLALTMCDGGGRLSAAGGGVVLFLCGVGLTALTTQMDDDSGIQPIGILLCLLGLLSWLLACCLANRYAPHGISPQGDRRLCLTTVAVSAGRARRRTQGPWGRRLASRTPFLLVRPSLYSSLIFTNSPGRKTCAGAGTASDRVRL